MLAPEARLGADPLLPLRAAYAAADHGLLLAPHTADRLGNTPSTLPTPWPAEARRLFTALLGTGPDLLGVWETCDQAGSGRTTWCRSGTGCAARRSTPRCTGYTVDRHLLDTCVEASRLVRRVYRPDLLLVGALLHDLGKGDRGERGDHSVTGAEIAARLAPRWGFDEADTATLVLLVRHHLLLADTATRRDLDDPTTIRQVAAVVGDADTLDLLAALTEADARATGSAAWTPWRAALVGRLVGHVRRHLERGQVPAPGPLAQWQRALAREQVPGLVVEQPEVEGEPFRITVVAPGRVGSLAIVAGVLALARLSVRSASVHTEAAAEEGVYAEGHTEGDVGVSIWTVTGAPPDPAVLRERLDAALSGRDQVAPRVARLDANRPGLTAGADVRVEPGASAAATVLEVRAHDRPGLFHQICAAVAATGCSVRSAHVSTWADNAVDVFYLTRPLGGPLEEAVAAKVAASVRAALGPDDGGPDDGGPDDGGPDDGGPDT